MAYAFAWLSLSQNLDTPVVTRTMVCNRLVVWETKGLTNSKGIGQRSWRTDTRLQLLHE